MMAHCISMLDAEFRNIFTVLMLDVILLNVIMLKVILLNVIMLNVIMPNVVVHCLQLILR